jgi:transcriptional regulator with XRE-family HTH domain
MSILYFFVYHYKGWKGDVLLKLEHADKYRQIGLKIAYYRKLRGFTQEQLAEKLGLSAAYIGHIEAPNINKALSLDTLFDIAQVLHVPAHQFLLFDETI